MIDDEKFYVMSGWAVSILINIIKSLKQDVTTRHQLYSKDEFINIITKYDNVIEYLLKLTAIPNNTEKHKSKFKFKNDEIPDIPDTLKTLLKNMNIKLDGEK